MDLPKQMDLCYVVDFHKGPELLIFRQQDFTAFLDHLSAITGKSILFSADWPLANGSIIHKVIVADSNAEAIGLEKEMVADLKKSMRGC